MTVEKPTVKSYIPGDFRLSPMYSNAEVNKNFFGSIPITCYSGALNSV